MATRNELIESRKQVIAGDNADANAIHAMLLRNGADRRGARRWVYAAGVGDPSHAAVCDGRQNALHCPDEVTRVTHIRITLFLFLQNAHRDFGEIVEHQIIDISSLDLTSRRREPISPKALSRRDAHVPVITLRNAKGLRLRHTSSTCAGRTNGPRCGPGFCGEARSASARTSRVSSGYTMASMNPRAPA